MGQQLRTRSWQILVAAVVVSLLYATNIIYCQHSVLHVLDAAAESSDMHANLLWARSIQDQGWLNPRPYHPWTDWMQTVAPYSQWVKWWGGEKIFQQSPLYAYLLSLFGRHYLLMRAVQAVMSIATCVFIGLFTAHTAGQRAGWIGFWLAALYAPFYLYSWPFLRDGLGWLITAALLWALAVLCEKDWTARDAAPMAWLAGVLLGLGFLAKESYQMLIPAVLIALVVLARQRKGWGIVARVAVGVAVIILPLLARNAVVQAPLLSSSNRFPETFIHGNAGTSSSYLGVLPRETADILYRTNGRPLAVVRETVASHPDGIRGWAWLQMLKLSSLLDPFESPDNLSFYFVAHISPVVRFGLRYWMVVPAALAGLALGIWRRERAHLWIWIFLPISLASILVGIPFSRYRQSLMVLWMPCAAYFLSFLWELLSRWELRKFGYGCGVLLAGWMLVLGPLARQPRERYERPSEYLLAAQVYHQLGDDQKAQEMVQALRQKFPDWRR